ncbi:MAG: FtsQ-type POTRA domain-containing protein, partial [Deltaproteobacteria bacterium]|nr:FtsQ-type POTRA domain-containing protein [Deltaproteobacteria bacterium]
MKKYRSFVKGRNRRRADKKRLLKRLALLTLLLALGLGSVWGVSYFLESAQFFQLKKVEVEGELKRFKEEDILAQAAISPESNLFKLSLEKISRRLESLDFVKEVRIHRRLPSTLVIQVTEYKPMMLLYTGRYYY